MSDSWQQARNIEDVQDEADGQMPPPTAEWADLIERLREVGPCAQCKTREACRESCYLFREAANALAERDRRIEALRQDAERLDWCERKAAVFVWGERSLPGGERCKVWLTGPPSLRKNIDAAIAGEK